jgi:hypothetical protein
MQAITDLAHDLLSSLSVQDRLRDEALTDFRAAVEAFRSTGLAMFREVDDRMQMRSQELLDDIEHGFVGLRESLSIQVRSRSIGQTASDSQLSEDLAQTASDVSPPPQPSLPHVEYQHGLDLQKHSDRFSEAVDALVHRSGEGLTALAVLSEEHSVRFAISSHWKADSRSVFERLLPDFQLQYMTRNW